MNDLIKEKQLALIKPLKKVIIFIDGNNLFHAMWSCYQTHRIDIVELAMKLCTANRELVQIRYYYSPLIYEVDPRTFKIQQKCIEELKKSSSEAAMQLIQGKYICKPLSLKRQTREKIKLIAQKLEALPKEEDELLQFNREDFRGYIEKGIDVSIAVDMLKLAIEDKYNTAILVSGDSDFVPAVREVIQLGKKVQVAAFEGPKRRCFDLKRFATSFQNLHHIVPSILKKQKSRNP